jgi:hypothetical protein
MLNPLNPLNWLKATQDWFVRAERSSGFRPYLIFLFLAFAAGLALIAFGANTLLQVAGLLLIVVPALCFIPLYAWKAHSDPDFCRSESHVQRLKRFELEMMGSQEKQIEGEILEQQSLIASEKDPQVLPSSTADSRDRDSR